MSNRKLTRKLTPDFAPLASSTIYGSRLRLDLDSTRISTSDSSERNNNNKKLDYAYNEYLQALAKKHIISTSIHQFQTLLQQQIDYQNHEIIKMRKECENKKTELNNVIKTNELVNVLRALEGQFEMFEEARDFTHVNQLISLSNIMGAACREWKLINVKRLSHIEEWFSLMKIMNECCKFLYNFFKSHQFIKEFELIDEISGRFKETLELQNYIQEQIAISSGLSKTISLKYLDRMKNLFDLLGTSLN